MNLKWIIYVFTALLGLGFLIFRLNEGYFISLLIEVSPASKYYPKDFYTYAYYADLVYFMFAELAWLIGLLILVFIFWRFALGQQLFKYVDGLLLKKPKRSVTSMLLIFFILASTISFVTLQQFPNSADEYVYLHQAKQISEGDLWEAPHPYPEFFTFHHIANKDDKWVGRFPPGWPLFLSLAFIAKIPPILINILLGAITLLVFYAFVKQLYDERIALWSLLCLTFTSFFLFNAASYFSHIVSLLQVLLFVFLTYRYLKSKKVVYALLAGFFLGLLIITRYYTALLMFLPFLFYKIYQYKIRAIVPLFFIGIGSIPCLIFLLWYNYTITGDALTPVTVWAYKEEGLGFVKGHTFIKSLFHIFKRFLMFLYWCSPPLLLLYFIFLWRKVKFSKRPLNHPEDYAFLALVIGYIFYYEVGGNQYGPRFYFEGLPFLIAFVVAKVIGSNQRRVVGLLMAGLIFSAVKIPFISAREHRIISERKDMYTLADKNNIHNAVIFISSPTGIVRPMPVNDLTRNDNQYENDIIYAKDLGEKNGKLMQYYSKRNFYRYERDLGARSGRLVKVINLTASERDNTPFNKKTSSN